MFLLQNISIYYSRQAGLLFATYSRRFHYNTLYISRCKNNNKERSKIFIAFCAHLGKIDYFMVRHIKKIP
jgi:hypothetical protein